MSHRLQEVFLVAVVLPLSSETFYLYILHSYKKNPRIFPSSWALMPAEVFSTMQPNWRDESRLFCHFSGSLNCSSNLGLITPHLFSLPMRFTVFPAMWWSVISNSPVQPCFIIIVRNLMMTLEHGLISNWHLPLFSALWVLLRASARTFMRTIMAARKDGRKS